jgi:hypothetical protein
LGYGQPTLRFDGTLGPLACDEFTSRKPRAAINASVTTGHSEDPSTASHRDVAIGSVAQGRYNSCMLSANTLMPAGYSSITKVRCLPAR